MNAVPVRADWLKRSYELRRNGRVVASAKVCWIGGHRAEFDDFHVLRDWRGQGIGSHLLRDVCAEADRDGMTLVLVACGHSGWQRRLVALYERFGFAVSCLGDGWADMERRPRARAVQVAA